MYLNDLNNSYVYESERRADEMREAALDQLLPTRKNHSAKVMMIILIISILIWLVI